MEKPEKKPAKDRTYLELTERAEALVDRVKKRTGQPRTEIGRRFFAWLVTQNETVQNEVLGLNAAESRVDVARIVLKKMASGEIIPPAAASEETAAPLLPPGTPKLTRKDRKKKGDADEKAG